MDEPPVLCDIEVILLNEAGIKNTVFRLIE